MLPLLIRAHSLFIVNDIEKILYECGVLRVEKNAEFNSQFEMRNSIRNSKCAIQFAIRNAQCAIICEVVLYLNDNSLCSVKNCGRE